MPCVPCVQCNKWVSDVLELVWHAASWLAALIKLLEGLSGVTCTVSCFIRVALCSSALVLLLLLCGSPRPPPLPAHIHTCTPSFHATRERRCLQHASAVASAAAANGDGLPDPHPCLGLGLPPALLRLLEQLAAQDLTARALLRHTLCAQPQLLHGLADGLLEGTWPGPGGGGCSGDDYYGEQAACMTLPRQGRGGGVQCPGTSLRVCRKSFNPRRYLHQSHYTRLVAAWPAGYV